MSKPVQKILLIFAMGEEARPTIETLGLEKSDKVLYPGVCVFGREFERKNNRFNCSLLLLGNDARTGASRVATQYAATCTALAIAHSRPDLIINVGTAGGFRPHSMMIGETYLCTNFIFHDRRIPLPKYDRFGVGGFETAMTCHPVGFHSATVTTGNSLDITSEELAVLNELAEDGPLLKDMESAAIAEICKDFLPPIPFVALKAVTDVVNGEKKVGAEFERNIQVASDSVRLRLIEFLAFLDEVPPGSFFSVRNNALIDRVLELRRNM